jgi:hypothetical protein
MCQSERESRCIQLMCQYDEAARYLKVLTVYVVGRYLSMRVGHSAKIRLSYAIPNGIDGIQIPDALSNSPPRPPYLHLCPINTLFRRVSSPALCSVCARALRLFPLLEGWFALGECFACGSNLRTYLRYC